MTICKGCGGSVPYGVVYCPKCGRISPIGRLSQWIFGLVILVFLVVIVFYVAGPSR